VKKTLISILIVITIAQLFVPFGVGIKNKQIGISKNIAEAVDAIKVKTVATNTDTKIYVDVKVDWGRIDELTGGEGVMVSLLDISGKVLESKQIKLVDVPPEEWDSSDPMHADAVQKGSDFFDVSPDTQYGITTVASHLAISVWDLLRLMPGSLFSTIFGKPEFDVSKTTIADPDPLPVTTSPKDQTTLKSAGEQTSVNENFALPVCGLDNIGGCVGIVLYRLVFQPSSYLFAITGKLLDSTLFYSIQDTSYRSQFVVEGWGIVRDVCNMFFIFILLYIAFSTILNTGGSKTKEMIIHLVVIGLLINFSLFAVQVLIDTSNVLTRVFYNQITTGHEDENGNIVENLGVDGSKELTAALVKKINPQQLIIRASDAGQIKAKGITSDEQENRLASGIDNATFIMVVIMSSIMNIVGLWVFFVISLVFIARVVGLWMAMILAPVAFFSYIVPKMNNIDMIGWSKWWPETIKLSFVAPVFMFFLYIILQFLDSGLGILDAGAKTGLDFYIAIIVPFAFLMVLLMKTKEITTKMSGTIGEKMVDLAKSVGGATIGTGLGLATGGAAMLGRATIGKAGNKLANSKWAKNMAGSDNALSKFIGNKTINAGEKISKKDWDFRNTKLGGIVDSSLKKETTGSMGKADKVGGYQGIQDKIAKRRIEEAERLKLTASEEMIQNEKAKKYSDQYEKDMLAERKRADSQGVPFDEAKFKADYQAGLMVDWEGNPVATHEKVKNADEINRDRMKKQMEIARNGNGTGDEDTTAKIVKDLKAKSKPEKQPLSDIQKYNAEKTIEKSEKQIEEARNRILEIENEVMIKIESELDDVNNSLESVAVETGVSLNEIKPEHITRVALRHESLISEKEADIIRLNKELENNPTSNRARLELIEVNKQKKQAETEIKKLNSLLTNKEKCNTAIEKQKETIERQREKIIRENDKIIQQNNILARRD